jgi:hypothetical protein
LGNRTFFGQLGQPVNRCKIAMRKSLIFNTLRDFFLLFTVDQILTFGQPTVNFAVFKRFLSQLRFFG